MNEVLHCRCCIAGGGPAGVMLGLLLARAGVDVLVLEKHADFLRDFRGDTVHPSTLQVLQELGLLEEFLTRPHDEARELHAFVSGVELPIADFSRLAHPFIALMPQWDFLDFLTDAARRYPGFRMRMNAEVQAPLQSPDGTVTGVRGVLRDREGHPTGDSFEVQATLTVAADGRHSVLRAAAGLTVHDLGAPIDVLWMRLPRRPADPSATAGRIERGRFLAMIDRGDYWQCAYVIRKGGIDTLRARGIAAFRADLVAVAPLFADRVDAALPDWDAVKLLSVSVDRLERWWRPGFVAIGDAAHAMSPVGGVGINLAVQDAVAAANGLAAALADPAVPARDLSPRLAALQRRRTWPVRATQAVQVFLHERLLAPVLDSGSPGERARAAAPLPVPWPLRLLGRWRWLRAIPAYGVGMGARPEHVRSPVTPPADPR